ncbi:hypothetical protein EV361DRAFT_967251 [Lentinula raphanica]|nr:hypothetical protein EV361DRAFT_967251 [Lentinula raphanica]
MDPEKLIEETNELLKKRNEKYFIGKDKVKDDVDWMHVTLMYLSMVEYAPGQTVLQEPDVYNFWFLHHWKDIKALRQEFLEDSKHHISARLLLWAILPPNTYMIIQMALGFFMLTEAA